MSSEAPIEITTNADLLRVIDEVHRTRKARTLSHDGEPIVMVVPVKTRAAKRRVSAQDYEAFLSSFGSWNGVVDVNKFLADNERSRSIAARPPVDL
jgi:hypothetical protein